MVAPSRCRSLVLAITGMAVPALLGSPVVVRAQNAAAPTAERCEGTLCDLYYSSRAGTAASGPVAPAPASGGLTNFFGRGAGPTNAQPIAPASSSNSYMSLGAGGVLGPKQETCSGTLCDVYYGASSPTDAAGRQEASAVTGRPASVPEPAMPHRHIVHESETRPKCSSPTADPWRCFR